jgi:myo-inositol-1(or 4)-monophosphatase
MILQLFCNKTALIKWLPLPRDLVDVPQTSGSVRNMANESRFELARAVAREAGELALGYFKNLASLKVETKGPQDVVSKADRAVEDFIRAKITDAFPGDAILGEEGGGAGDLDGDAPIWVIDPIDGTQCFLNGLSTWCISIALVHQGRIVFGAVQDPCNDELFSGGPGLGSFCNQRPIQVSQVADLTMGMMEVGYSSRVSPALVLGVLSRLMDAGGMYHRCGAGALAMAHLAAGRYVAYFEEHMNSWDSFAAAAIIHGAGGWTNDLLANDGLTKGAMVVAGGYPIAEALKPIVGTDFGRLVGQEA